MKTYIITVTGRVQHVGFRWSTAQIALRLNIRGFVKNLPNGDVYIEAQGQPERIDRFVERIKNNPAPLSQVEYLDQSDRDQPPFKSFEIR